VTEDKLCPFLEQEVINRESRASGYQARKAKRKETWKDGNARQRGRRWPRRFRRKNGGYDRVRSRRNTNTDGDGSGGVSKVRWGSGSALPRPYDHLRTDGGLFRSLIPSSRLRLGLEILHRRGGRLTLETSMTAANLYRSFPPATRRYQIDCTKANNVKWCCPIVKPTDRSRPAGAAEQI
jgi:hypothetical protein